MGVARRHDGGAGGPAVQARLRPDLLHGAARQPVLPGIALANLNPNPSPTPNSNPNPPTLTLTLTLTLYFQEHCAAVAEHRPVDDGKTFVDEHDDENMCLPRGGGSEAAKSQGGPTTTNPVTVEQYLGCAKKKVSFQILEKHAKKQKAKLVTVLPWQVSPYPNPYPNSNPNPNPNPNLNPNPHPTPHSPNPTLTPTLPLTRSTRRGTPRARTSTSPSPPRGSTRAPEPAMRGILESRRGRAQRGPSSKAPSSQSSGRAIRARWSARKAPTAASSAPRP